MNRIARLVASVALCTTLLPLGCARSPQGALHLTGSVSDDSIVLPTPTLPVPAADLEVGFSSAATPTSEFGSSAHIAAQAAWLKVEDVPVSIGDEVIPGQPVVVFDPAPFTAALEKARADERRAETDLALLGAKLDETSTGLEDIEEQRSQLETAVAELEAQRDDLLVRIEAARALVGSPVPTGTPDPASTVAELEAALAKVDTAIEDTRKALTQLDQSGGQLGSAKSALEGAQRAARATVDARTALVGIAQADLDHTSLTAPVAGVVLDVPRLGSVLAAGAPAVTLRPRVATLVTTWVTADERERIMLGAAARVTGDSDPEDGLEGAVQDIGVEYAYVPTTFGTKNIHMSRGFEVTVVVFGDRSPPPGTPVDVTIETLDSALR